NSDNLFLNAFCVDVLSGADLSGWNFPGAPYLFPDMLLLLPCQWLGRDLVAVYFAYDGLFYGALLAALYGLGRQLGLTRRAAFVCAAAALTFLAVTYLRGAYRGVGQLLGHPGNHVGAVLVGVLLLALFARALRRGHGPAGAAGFVLVCGLGALSDKLLLVQFVLPACLALGLLWLWRKISFGQLARHAALVGAALLAARGLELLAVRFGWKFQGAGEDFRRPHLADLAPLFGQLWRVVGHQHILLAVLPLTLLAGLLVLWARRGAGRAGDAPAGEGVGALFVALAVLLEPACNLLAVFAVGLGRHPAVDRYCVALYLLPFLFLGLLVRLLPGRPARLAGAGLLAFVVALALHQLGQALPAVRRAALAQPYPPLAQAIDRLVEEYGPMRGVAGYWSARHLSFLTHSRTPIVPILTDCSPYPHGSNANAYLDPRPGLVALPEYRLIVVAESRGLAPTPEVLAAQFGPPRKTVRVGPDQLWLYDRLDNVAFDRFLRAQAARRVRRAAPPVGPDSPRALARPKANGTPATGRGVVALGPGQVLEVRFPRPVSACLLDVAADYRDRGRLLFYRGAEQVGALTVPAVPWHGMPHWQPGLQARLLEAPPGLRGRAWDRIVIEPCGPAFRVGHLLAYEQEVPGLFPPAAGRAGPQRLEAEGMLSAAPPGSVVADPEASGGRARQAPAGFGGCLTFGPYVALRPGRYDLDVCLRVDDNSSAEPAVRVEAVANWGVDRLAGRTLHGADFPAAGRYATYRLSFEAAGELDTVEFRAVPLGKAGVRVDYFELTRRPPE
ncbi:MAG TPA: hypothetical protein VFE78_13585, partial [Gemmataceae bacterium]|nr:hypothetical protein [Gemmataceae bacterium]